MRTSLTFQKTSRGASLKTRGFCIASGKTMENFLMKFWNSVCGNFFLQGNRKFSERIVGFMLCCKLGFDLSATSELPIPNMKIRLQLIRARSSFYKISDIPNVSLGINDCSLCTGRILNKHYHIKTDTPAKNPVELNYWKALAKTFIVSSRQNKGIHKNTFINALNHRMAIAMNTNSAITWLVTEDHFWHQQFNLRQIRTLKGVQLIVDFNGADNCHLQVTKEKAMNFQEDIPSIQIAKFETTLN